MRKGEEQLFQVYISISLVDKLQTHIISNIIMYSRRSHTHNRRDMIGQERTKWHVRVHSLHLLMEMNDTEALTFMRKWRPRGKVRSDLIKTSSKRRKVYGCGASTQRSLFKQTVHMTYVYMNFSTVVWVFCFYYCVLPATTSLSV